jgi:hypothetical protein
VEWVEEESLKKGPSLERHLKPMMKMKYSY